MADIVLSMGGIAGESEKDGYSGQIDCLILRETLEVPRGGSTRRAKHSDIELTRMYDAASPKLMAACSAGTEYAQAEIFVLRSNGDVHMYYDLTNVVVSKIERETRDQECEAFLPHTPTGVGQPTNFTSPDPTAGSGALAIASQKGIAGQLMARPYIGTRCVEYTAAEVERIWLNAEQVTWKFNTGSGNVVRGWDILRGRVASTA